MAAFIPNLRAVYSTTRSFWSRESMKMTLKEKKGTRGSGYKTLALVEKTPFVL